jgi:hypothetical protein
MSGVEGVLPLLHSIAGAVAWTAVIEDGEMRRTFARRQIPNHWLEILIIVLGGEKARTYSVRFASGRAG